MKNLQHIEEAFQEGKDVYVVTQVVISLQAIVVFPWEHGKLKGLSQEPLSVSCGAWLPLKKDTYAERCTSLHVLLRHVRNALSHRRLEFSSDSRDIKEVVVTFSDRNKATGHLEEWSAEIRGDELRVFCAKIVRKFKLS